MNNNEERAFDWEDEIIKDGNDFILLPEGDYDFRIAKFERGRHAGSEKLPACPKAILTIELFALSGDKTTVEHNLFLHSKTEGILSAFFAAIGQKKKGEPLKMKWPAVTGSTGRCKVIIEDWEGKNGEKMQSNRIKKFYPAEVEFKEGTF